MLRFLLGWNAWILTESALWVGITGALMLAPALLFSPYFGVQSDRVNPRHGLMLSMLIHGAIAITGAVTTLLGAFTLLTLLLLAGALGSVSAMHSPMRLALVPLLVPRAALPSAVGLTAMSFNIARILGPVICAAVIAQYDVALAWGIAAVIFAVAGIILSALRGVGTRQQYARDSVSREFFDGVHYVLKTPAILLILASTSINGFLGRSFIELLPAVSGRLIQGGATELAWITAAAGSGAVLGGFVMTRQRADVTQLFSLIMAALLFAAALLLSLILLSELPSLAAMVGMLSFFTTLAGTGCQTLAQLVVDKQYHGRVMSLWSMTMMAAPAFGAATHGALAEWQGFVVAFAVAAIFGAVGVSGLYARRRSVVELVPDAMATSSDSK